MASNSSKIYRDFISESQRELDRLSKYSEQEILTQFEENSWSVNQVLQHLLTIERQVLIYMKKKMLDPKLHTASFRNWWKLQLTILLLRSPLKFKAPAKVADIPNSGSLEELKVAFAKTRKDMEEFIYALPSEYHNKLLFRHPRSGMLSLNQTISFLHSHWVHHRAQLKTLEQRISTKK